MILAFKTTREAKYKIAASYSTPIEFDKLSEPVWTDILLHIRRRYI